ncbi:MAG: hypothetical protein J6Q24_05075 [Clostridia bacterium]|nr:hypothetical protein [Clostridia bacterium]
MDFNPIDKIPELTELLKAYNPIIRTKTDKGYDWLAEDSFCIEIPNLNADKNITIECENEGEFTVCFAYFHSHYLDDYGYSNMCEDLSNLLTGKTCSAAIFCGSGNEWKGSTIIEKEKLSLPVEEIFSFVFENKKSAEKLRTNGGEARFDFWDGSLNKIIKL